MITEKIIHLVIVSSYLKDDPERKYDKAYWLSAYENKEKAWERVRELIKKEQIRVENLNPENWDYNIRNQYAIDSIILYGNTTENEKTKI